MKVEVSTVEAAEQACRMVFGVNADLGPLVDAPPPLLQLKRDWPGKQDDVVRVALHLPHRFDLERDMGKDNVKSIELRVHRLDVVHMGKFVGFALRTDQIGIDAIDLFNKSWAMHRRLRAH